MFKNRLCKWLQVVFSVVDKCYPCKMHSVVKQLCVVNDFEADLDHDQHDDHPF